MYVLSVFNWKMRVLPYFVMNIKSTRSIAELKGLIKVYAQKRKYALDSEESNDELEFSANDKNKFLVTTKTDKWLAIDGMLNEHAEATNVQLTFRMKTFTNVFHLIIYSSLLMQLLLNNEDRLSLILFIFFIYLASQLYFNRRTDKLKNQLIRILQ